MAELTDNQVKRAWEAFCDGNRGLSGLRTAAPFLQLPWDEPNQEEWAQLSFTNSSDAEKFRAWIRRRNAALIPKPVDPRIDLIDKALCNFMHSLNNTEERTKAAQAIIAVLDEVK